ncbi:MAG: SCO family protein [Oleispira antarctica]|nr:SCO family protein [Oleispira antarctica]MBQ0793080.1 SCO family protein [Oleispira antarctica]
MKTLMLVLFFYCFTPAWAAAPVDTNIAGASLIGGAFNLINNRGKQVTERDYQDKYMLVFFGFTNCPSVCPLGLSRMAKALKKIDNFEDKITPLFITVDPERDTPERMTLYLEQYHSYFVGLTGSDAQLEQVSTAYRAYSFKSQDPNSDSYSFDHSSMIYFMDKEGRYITHFSNQITVDEMSSIIRKNIEEK